MLRQTPCLCLFVVIAVGITSAGAFETAFFTTAGECARCHDGMSDAAGTDVSIVPAWEVSMMAFSFVDPLWQAKVSAERRRLPELDAAIQEKCARCHAPMASVEAIAAGDDVVIFDGGFTDPEHPLHALAMEGVSCTLCHQIADTPELGTDEGTSGGFTVEPAATPRERQLFGQHHDLFTFSMRSSVEYTPVGSDHVSSSEVCACCHELKTAYVDAASESRSVGNTLFPEQMPYSEWLNSIYGPGGADETPCLGCHMVQTGGAQAAHAPAWLPEREPFSRHDFATENTLMLGIIERFADFLGISVGDITGAVDEVPDYLGGAGSVEVLSASLVDGLLEVDVRVSNLTGHKMPTGIPIRRAYIHVVVSDRRGRVVFESGHLNDDHTITGVDADGDLTAFEPHRDVITAPDQVQVYEGIMADTEGEVTYTLLRAASFLKDNRLLPLGFDPDEAPVELAPAGACTNDDDFIGGSDVVTYRVSGLRRERYLVTVELRDQPVAPAVVADLALDGDDPVIRRFLAFYADTEGSSELIAATSVEVRQSKSRG